MSNHSQHNLPEAVGCTVAIGSFDGVHRGHAELVQVAVARARQEEVEAVILTFDPHPRTFFRPEAPVFRLTPPATRARILAALGVDRVVTLTFDKPFSQLTPEAFEQSILADELGAGVVVVGEGFRFGRARAGTVDQLVASGDRWGYDVVVVGPVVDESGERISSSAIRQALSAGDITTANRMLGYRWFVEGTVIAGDRRGRDLGFPTANIRLPDDCRLRHGVYAVTLTRQKGLPLAGVASFGRRPQFDDGPPLLEVFVFDFAADLYGEEVVVTFFDWIRSERTFPTVGDLVAAMQMDVESARSMLAAAGPGSALDEALRERGEAPSVVAASRMG